MFIDIEARMSRERKRLDTFDADVTVNKSKDLQFGAGYRYERHENSQVTGQLMYHINRENWKDHWAFKIYERYELQEKIFQEQQ